MLNKEMEKALNEQIRNEFASAYLYLSMAAWFEQKNLPGFAAWMRKQSEEEWQHGLKIYQHIVDRGGCVTLLAIPQPKAKWDSNLGVFEDVLAHEEEVSSAIHKLYELAVKTKDYASQPLLHWFINEQVEEEKVATEIREQLKMVEARLTAVLMVDHRLGKRGKGEE
jgi:ferritin